MQCLDPATCPHCQKELKALTERVAEKTKAVVGQLPDPPKPKPPPQPEKSRVKYYRPSKNQPEGEGNRMFDVHSFHTTGLIECAFPPCTNTFKAMGQRQLYCGKQCRKKDGPFRRKREEFERAQATS